MSELEDLKTGFAKKLDERISRHEQRTQAELTVVRDRLLRESKAELPADLERRSHELTRQWQSVPVQPLLDLSHSNSLQELDEAFIQAFNLGAWYPLAPLRYPTVYCETLEEFCQPLVDQMDISPDAKRQAFADIMNENQETASETGGGGVFGYNLPGLGAYLNGWLFSYNTNLTTRQAFQHPEIARRILGTAAHEKLGHGFLSVYSAMGQVKVRLGLTLADLTRKFGLRNTDDPTSSLRREQANLFFMVSQLLEEGWSTWTETYLGASFNTNSPHPRHDLQSIMAAIDVLPKDMADRKDVQETLKAALVIIFGEEDLPLHVVQRAVYILEYIGTQLDDFFSQELGQPLRYAAGELILVQAEKNLGPGCVPYAALIAANVTFDPAAVGLADLRDLFQRDPRLNPDLRMAALSRIQLTEKGNVTAMAKMANDIFSFSIPQELK